MKLYKIIKMFKQGNVCVTGLRGTGKDMLIGNVIIRRNKEYISNIYYGGKYIPLNISEFNTKNNIDNLINNDIKKYNYPYKDNIDIYISDVGIYFPAQEFVKLNKKYDYITQFVALTRQLGQCNMHINTQTLNRAWDKLREQSDTYILCNKCKVLFGKIIIQSITIYDKYESCISRVPKFPLRKPIFNKYAIANWQLSKTNYLIQYGDIKKVRLVYINKSKYDTRYFKHLFEKGSEQNETTT